MSKIELPANGEGVPGKGEEERLRLVKSAYEDLDRGDLISFLGILDDQVEWQHPAGLGPPLGRVHRGPLAVVQDVLGELSECWEDIRFSPSTFLAGPGHVVVLGDTTFRGVDGRSAGGQFAHVWMMHNERAARVLVFEDTAIAMLHRRGPEGGS